MLKKAISIMMIGIVLVMSGCGEQNPKTITDNGDWDDKNVTLNEIELFWEEGYFIHNSLRVDIVEDWSGIGKKSDFDDLDKHDLIYQYKVKTISYYDGSTEIVTELKDIDHEPPEEREIHFIYALNFFDLESKLLIQDELANDYYLKIDFIDGYNNFCYIRMSKNDVNQLREGSFNEIQGFLMFLHHVDGTISYKVKTEDGLINVGYYDEVKIYYNPEWEE